MKWPGCGRRLYFDSDVAIASDNTFAPDHSCYRSGRSMTSAAGVHSILHVDVLLATLLAIDIECLASLF